MHICTLVCYNMYIYVTHITEDLSVIHLCANDNDTTTRTRPTNANTMHAVEQNRPQNALHKLTPQIQDRVTHAAAAER